MTKGRVLIFDDDRLMRHSIVDLVEAAGWTAKALARATDAARWIAQFQPDVILSDVRMPDVSGLDLLAQFAQTAAPPIVLISAHGDIPMAVAAMNAGAYSFLEKPYDPKRLLTILDHAADQQKMRAANARLKSRLQQLTGLDRVLLGNTAQIVRLRDTLHLVADADGPVLVQGETGTGKDLVARALHDVGSHAGGPYVAINAAQFSAAQLPLIARNAAGGTLFLDEICACPIEVQPMLLRLIEVGEILPPDEGTPEKISLRVTAATNEDPHKAVAEGRLRRDLLHRLETFHLNLPPLRERRDDIVLLFTRFLENEATTYDMVAPELASADLSVLMAHDWPGNVRELRNVAQRCVLQARQGFVSVSEAMAPQGWGDTGARGLRDAVAAFERQIIARAMRAKEGRMDDVAEALGIGRRTLNEKIVKLGLDKDTLL